MKSFNKYVDQIWNRGFLKPGIPQANNSTQRSQTSKENPPKDQAKENKQDQGIFNKITHGLHALCYMCTSYL